MNEKLTRFYDYLWKMADEFKSPHNLLLEMAQDTEVPDLLQQTAKILTDTAGEFVLLAANLKDIQTIQEHKNVDKLKQNASDINLWPNLNRLANVIDSTQGTLQAEAIELDHIFHNLPNVISSESLNQLELQEQNLLKQASVLDALLLSFGNSQYSSAEQIERFKKAEEEEIDNLREKYRQKKENLYDVKKTPTLATEQIAKNIDKTFKEYRPMEAPLSVRNCPDHPGVQAQRIADDIYQCSIDKKIINYREGYTTGKGNKIPGSSVSNQSQQMNDLATRETSFNTRESLQQQNK